MAVVLRCPECQTSHRRGRAPAPGEEIECPKCGAEFVPTPVEADESDEDDSPRARRPERRERADEEAPRARRSARRERDEDEDEEGPRRARKRPRDADDEDERPRRKRSREPQRSNNTVLVLAGVAGVGLLGLIGVGAVAWALIGRDAKPAQVAQAPVPEARPAPVPQNLNDPVTQPRPKPAPDPAGPAGASGPAPTDKELLEKARKATVLIRVEVGTKASSGSGFVVRTSPDAAYVVTNYHVVSSREDEPPAQPQNPGGRPRPPGFPPPMPRPPMLRPPGFGPGAPKQPAAKSRPRAKVAVVFHSGTPEEQAHPADVVALDPEADLATLKVSGARNVPAPLDVTQEAPVSESMPVFIYGFPGGDRTITVGEGKVSQLRRDDAGTLSDVQINGQINPGNSGGPVVDGRGRLVGIAVSTVRGKNLGFAIPAAHLDHMLKGSVLAGLVFQVRQQGAIGEFWFLDRKSKVAGRDVFQGQLGGAQGTTPNEFLVLAALNDPMHKLNAVKAHFAPSAGAAPKPGPDGWAALPRAETIALKMRDDEALGTFKLPAGAFLDDTFAFQFSYTNAEGHTVYTQPHLLRLTFPKSPKSMTLRVTTPTDEPSRRYVDDTILKALAGPSMRLLRTPQGVHVELDPVEDPKAVVAKITFGEVVSVEGRTVTVKVGPVELPLPTEQELMLALNDLKTTDRNRHRAGADRLAKVYAIVPDRREEIAKALEPLALDKDHFTRSAALNALGMWSGPETVPALIQVLETSDGPVRATACNLLVKYKDASAAPALAKCLPGPFERGPASAALKAIGPKAEKEVIPLLTHKDAWVASEACNILKEIGTELSVAPLQEVLKGNPNFMVGPAASNALKAIQERKKAAPKK